MKDIQMMPIKSVIPYANNPRNNKEAVDKVAASLREFGFRQPIVVDKNMVVIAGHTRLAAAKKLKMKEVPVLVADDLSDEKVKAYRLTDNKVAEFSKWDEDLLNIELGGILDIDMEQFGFDLDFEDEDEDSAEIEEDEFTDDVESRCKVGDIWLLGSHRLICGDSTDVTVIDRLMDGVKADCVFTDPPYNIAGKSSNFTKNSDSPHMRALAQAKWDKNFNIREALDNILIALSENATVYICTSHFLAGEIWQWMDEWAKHVQYCVWSKPNPMPSLAKRHWTWNTELICYATRGKHTFNFPKEGHALSTWTINTISGKTGHPTEKPVEVPAMAVSHSSKENDVVLDLFGGSGSTLIACEQLNRKCYMCELDEHYCDVILSRWEQLTGQEAVLLSDVQTDSPADVPF